MIKSIDFIENYLQNEIKRTVEVFMETSYIILGFAALIVLAIAFLILMNKSKNKKRIERQTAYLEVQGYKRKLRRENALKFLDNDTLVSLESQGFTKDEAKMLMDEAEKQVKEGKFQEDRLMQDHKERKNVWTGS